MRHLVLSGVIIDSIVILNAAKDLRTHHPSGFLVAP